MRDFDQLARKTLGFLLAGGPLLVPAGVALVVLGRVLDARVPPAFAVAAAAIAVGVLIAIPRLRHRLDGWLHRRLFPERFDARRGLRELAEALLGVIERDTLLRRLGESLRAILDVEPCEVFVQDERGHGLVRVFPPGPGEPLPASAATWLAALREPTLVGALAATRQAAAALFRQRGWVVGVPLRMYDRLSGFVALGPSRRFRRLAGEDLHLLAVVGASASLALDNVRVAEQLRRSEVSLARANRLSSLGQLAAGIAHEIRNPLVAVKTFLDLLPERLEDREFLVRFRELSLSELARVTSLIQDLLSFGKSPRVERRPVDLPATLEPVVRLMETAGRKRQVAVVTTFAPDLPPVLADPGQLRQIALNLLLNAIEASSAGARVALVVGTGRDARSATTVVLEVHDEGSGIPREQQEDIFLPFFTTKETGTGLGLSLVHQLVLEHGGEIGVESELGRWTVFRVVLPAAEVPQPLAPTGT